MKFIWDGVKQAFELIFEGNGDVFEVLGVTLHVAIGGTLLAVLVGLPLGLACGLGRFRGRRVGLALLNAGLGLPPVVVGLFVALFLFRGAPLGGLELIYTINGIILAQAILAFPIVGAFTATAVDAVPRALFDQARALGASRPQLAVLALREARVGVIGATIAAFGSALSEVGAVVLVGGNIHGQTQTLATAVLTEVSAGEYGTAIAFGLLLLGLVLICGAALTIFQYAGEGREREQRGILPGWRAS
ncbi:MAG: ABC transporter permease [Actinobacteria bacterium]|nr:ABC transporter permease [Actinomycetota bacterium]